MKILISSLDRKFSLYIRSKANWTCEVCGRYFLPAARRTLQVSHFHGRRKKSVRFDPDNCSAQCFSCHRRFTENPLEFAEWMLRRLGQREFDLLTLRANAVAKPDYEMIRLWLAQAMKGQVADSGQNGG